MTDVSDDDLEKIRQDNEELRAKIAEAESLRAQREAGVARELLATQLEAENVRLTAELARVTESAEVGEVESGTVGLMEQARAQLAQATALAEQPVGPVDTNDPNAPEGTTGAVSGEDTAAAEAAAEALPDQPTNTTQIGGNS